MAKVDINRVVKFLEAIPGVEVRVPHGRNPSSQNKLKVYYKNSFVTILPGAYARDMSALRVKKLVKELGHRGVDFGKLEPAVSSSLLEDVGYSVEPMVSQRNQDAELLARADIDYFEKRYGAEALETRAWKVWAMARVRAQEAGPQPIYHPTSGALGVLYQGSLAQIFARIAPNADPKTHTPDLYKFLRVSANAYCIDPNHMRDGKRMPMWWIANDYNETTAVNLYRLVLTDAERKLTKAEAGEDRTPSEVTVRQATPEEQEAKKPRYNGPALPEELAGNTDAQDTIVLDKLLELEKEHGSPVPSALIAQSLINIMARPQTWRSLKRMTAAGLLFEREEVTEGGQKRLYFGSSPATLTTHIEEPAAPEPTIEETAPVALPDTALPDTSEVPASVDSVLDLLEDLGETLPGMVKLLREELGKPSGGEELAQAKAQLAEVMLDLDKLRRENGRLRAALRSLTEEED